LTSSQQGEPTPQGQPDASVGPFAIAVEHYIAKGWIGSLPLGNGPRQKAEPPKGFTGHEGRWPNRQELEDWKRTRGDRNIGQRLEPGIVGVDVDAYGDKPGAKTLAGAEAAHGPLPATWVSSSREAPSGIRFYRAPAETYPGSLKDPATGESGVEIIQFSHRYAVVAPSIHPETGDAYRWTHPDGTQGGLPSVDELPQLPPDWVDHLMGTCDCYAGTRIRVGSGDAVADRLDEAMAGLASGSRHDGVLGPVLALVGFANRGSLDAERALRTIHDAFIAAVTAPGTHQRGRDEAEREWDRMTTRGKAASAGAGEPAWDEPSGPVPEAHDDREWEDVPLPNALTQYPPRLSERALVGLVGDIARATVELTGCDPLSPVIHLIGMWGVLTPQETREAALEQPAREFVLPVGRTGGTRKGTVYSSIERLLNHISTIPGEYTVAWQGGSGEGLFTHIATEGREPRALVFADEFGQILAQAQRSGQTVLAAFRSLWNPEGRADVKTRKNPVSITGAHVAAVFHTTPEEAQSGFRSGEVTTGLVNRLLVARLRRAEYRAYTAQYPSEVFQDLTTRLGSAFLIMPKGIVVYSDEARVLWEGTKPLLEDNDDAPGADILARSAGHVARIALIYSLIEGHERIEEVDLRAALAVWDVCRHSALLLFGAMTGDPEADRLYAVISQYGGRMTRTQLRDALGRHGRRDDTEHALVMLSARGLIRRRRRRTAGRAEEVVEVLDLSGTGVSDLSDISDPSPAEPEPRSPRSHMSQTPVPPSAAVCAVPECHGEEVFVAFTGRGRLGFCRDHHAEYKEVTSVPQAPICSCGHRKVSAAHGRWVCTNGPAHAKPITKPMTTEAIA
jgi:hypothetical protein